MGTVTTLINIMRKFTYEGQDATIKFLKDNRRILSEELGFAQLPTLLAGRGELALLEKELLNPNDSIKGIVAKELDNIGSALAKKLLLGHGVETFSNNMQKISSMLLTTIVKPINLIKDLSQNFASKKNALIRYCVKNKLVTDKGVNYAEYLNQVDTPEKLFAHIDNIRTVAENRACTIAKEMKLATELDEFFAIQKNDGDLALELQKIILSPQKNKKVLEIETQLKNLYGLDYVYVRDVENGEKILNALEIAKKNNLPIPNNIVVTPYIAKNALTTGQHFNHTNGTTTIILQADNEIEVINAIMKNKTERLFYKSGKYQTRLKQESDTYNSTNNPFHIIIHEIIHGERNILQRKTHVPERFNATIKKLTGYAKEKAQKSNFEEVRTELRTKEVLIGNLSSEEKELLNYLS